VKLVLPLPPLGNRYKQFDRKRGFYYRTKEADQYRLRTGKYAVSRGLWPTPNPVAVSVRIFRKRKAGDIDGWLKVLLDSLEGVAYVNDSQIVELHAYRFDDKADPRVEVEVTEHAPSVSSATPLGH
jgi:Holliday junction resolvase RusA-like endonuclease